MKRNSRRRIWFAAASLAVNVLSADVAMSAQNYIAPILQFQPPNYNEDCVWFTLVGVGQADPIPYPIILGLLAREPKLGIAKFTPCCWPRN